MRRTALALVFSALCLSLAGQRPVVTAAPVIALQTPVNPVARAAEDFKKRVDTYLELRKEVARKYPEVKETGDPAKISEREKALGKGIAMARPHARPGDIFGPEMSKHLLTIVENDWRSRSPADRKALLEEIPANLQLRVNQPYPTTIPLATVPPKLLERLPMIPEELEYRLVDRRLLLRDRDANLILDVLAGAEPKRAQ